MKFLSSKLCFLILAAGAVAQADSIVTYDLYGTGTLFGPGQLNGMITVDESTGSVQSFSATATGLGSLVPTILSLSPPSISVSSPAPGEIAFSVSAPEADIVIPELATLFGVTLPPKLNYDFAGTYTGTGTETIGGTPKTVAGTLVVSLAPEPAFTWLTAAVGAACAWAGLRTRRTARS